jgi:cbb3-type cytochrome oxidase maturation protein
MNIIYLAIPLAIVLGSFFLLSFFWAVLQDQYDDVETPAHRMLLDDEKLVENPSVQKEKL